MLKLNRKDLKNRFLVQKFEEQRLFYKALILNNSIKPVDRFFFQHLLMKLPKNSSKTRVVNRCVLTGRGRGTFNLFNVSRIQLKALALLNKMPGLQKISW